MKKFQKFIVVYLIILFFIILFTIIYSFSYLSKNSCKKTFTECENKYEEGYNDALYNFKYDWMPITFCEVKKVDDYCEWLEYTEQDYFNNNECLYYFQEKTFEEAMKIINE